MPHLAWYDDHGVIHLPSRGGNTVFETSVCSADIMAHWNLVGRYVEEPAIITCLFCITSPGWPQAHDEGRRHPSRRR